MNAQTQTQKRHYHVYRVRGYEWDSINGEYLARDEPFYIRAIDNEHLINRLENWLKADMKEAEKDGWDIVQEGGDGDENSGDLYFIAVKGEEEHTAGYEFELVK